MILKQNSKISTLRICSIEENDYQLQDVDRFKKIPELRLWCEVIFRADYDVQTYLQYKGYHMWNDAINAKKWIYSPSEKPYSFIWACESTFPNIYTKLIAKIRERTPQTLPIPENRLVSKRQLKEFFNLLPPSNSKLCLI